MSGIQRRIKSFQNIIDDYTPELLNDDELLSFCHTTTHGYAVNILLNNMTTPQPCEVYKEELTYFFYGKAAYLVDDDLANYTDNPPITFIFNSSTIKQYLIERMLPFDSGGFDRYEFRPGFLRKNFTSLKPEIQKILAYVRLLYQNHENYLDNVVDLTELKKHRAVCMEAEQMADMYERADEGKINAGQQVYAIEVQFQQQIAFAPTHIVLPFDFYTMAFWGESVKADYPDIKIVHYAEKEIMRRRGRVLEASEYQRLMREKVESIIRTV